MYQISQDLLPCNSDEQPAEIIITKTPDEYFPKLTGKNLINGALPYQLHKSFDDGMDDLKDLVHRTDQEGMFIFDPAAEIWFSLGGQTNLGNGFCRHEVVSYDVSRLSAYPVHVHMHPAKLETMIVPPADAMPDPSYQKRWTKFLSAMPSRADYQIYAHMMRDAANDICIKPFIVNSLGVTELTLSSDVDAIDVLGNEFRTMKDITLLEYDYAGCTLQPDGQEREFVHALLPAINGKLPSGFKIALTL